VLKTDDTYKSGFALLGRGYLGGDGSAAGLDDELFIWTMSVHVVVPQIFVLTMISYKIMLMMIHGNFILV